MNGHRAWLLGWSAVAATTILGLAMLAFGGGVSGSNDGPGFSLAVMLATLSFSIVGAVVVSRYPRNWLGWIFCASPLLVALSTAAGAYVHQNGADAGGPAAVAWLSDVAWVIGAGLLWGFSGLLFPTGGLPSPRWRPVAWTGGVSLALSATGFAFGNGRIADSAIENPFAVPGAAALQFALFGVLGAAVAGVIAIVVRFRHGDRVLREQIKWAMVALVAFTTFALGNLAAQALGRPGAPKSAWAAMMALVPITTGIAILRYRLYEIDVIIRKTLVYACLVAVLGAVYVIGVTLLGSLVQTVSGSGALAVTLSTLAVAALFQPLRARIQRTVDSRFYRGSYDSARTLEAFSARLREQIDLDALQVEVLGIVQQTLQPGQATLWLRSPEEST